MRTIILAAFCFLALFACKTETQKKIEEVKEGNITVAVEAQDAQMSKPPLFKEDKEGIEKLIAFIKNDKVTELAKHIDYPLERESPLPSIKNQEEFKKYYHTIFDEDFKNRLTSVEVNAENAISNRFTGLLGGEIWFDGDTIIAINYHSAREQELLKELKDDVKSRIHKSLSKFDSNLYYFETSKHTIRLDYLENGTLRYASWNKPKYINEQPDLVLFDGEEDIQGQLGDATYTFRNGSWAYIVDEVATGEDTTNLGTFFRLSSNNKVVFNEKVNSLKK